MSGRHAFDSYVRKWSVHSVYAMVASEPDWNAGDITFEAHNFSCSSPPEMCDVCVTVNKQNNRRF